MRAILFVLIAALVLVIAAIASGFVNIRNIRGAPPVVSATSNAVAAKGGQPPAFDVETGSVKVGTRQATVNVPTLVVERPGQKQAVTNNAQ